MNIKTLVTALALLFSAQVFAEQYALEVETIRLKQSGSFAVLDARYTNTSPNDLKNWSIGFELVDNDGNGLAASRSMVRAIASGQSRITDVMFDDVDAQRVGGVRVMLDGVVDYSGLRVDKDYILILK